MVLNNITTSEYSQNDFGIILLWLLYKIRANNNNGMDTVARGEGDITLLYVGISTYYKGVKCSVNNFRIVDILILLSLLSINISPF